MGARACWRARCTEVAAAVVCMTAALAGCGADPDLAIPGATQGAIDRCDWPMWGHGLDRTFSYPCRTDLSPSTVGDLERRWFFNTADVVTSTPAVVDDTVYVGDWSGRFYALRREDGRPRWTYDTEVHPNVYSGQIVSSPAVADVEGERTVFVAGGKTLYALRADDGQLLWRHELRPDAGGQDPTEFETSPVVVDGLVVLGWDVHNSDAGEPAGVLALDAASGEERWTFRTEESPAGCGDVWGSASVDVERRLVFAGSANCPSSPEGWGPYTEALFALDLDTGEPQWSYQPHDPNNDDFDFAGAPNLFEDEDGRELVGLGNKDAVYYAVDRDTGEEVWRRKVAEPGITRRGSNFSTGGFIGPTAYADGIIVGGTAVGGDPYLHAIDATTGEIRWQQPEAAATYAASVEANGVVFVGGTDFTLRGLDLRTGEVLWRQEMTGVVAGGAVVVGNDVDRGGRHPRARPRRAEQDQRRHPVLARRRSRRSRPPRVDHQHRVHLDDRAAAGARAGVRRRAVPVRLRPRRAAAGRDAERELEVTLDPWTVTLPGRGARPTRGVAPAGQPGRAGRRRRLRPVHVRKRRQPARRSAVRARRGPVLYLRRGAAPGRDLQPDHAPRDRVGDRSAQRDRGRRPAGRHAGLRASRCSRDPLRARSRSCSASLLVGCSDDDGDGDAGASSTTSSTAADGSTSTSAPAEGPEYFVFNGQGNNLAAYDPEQRGAPPHRRERRHGSGERSRHQRADLLLPRRAGPVHRGRGHGPARPAAGWGIFELSGATLGELSVEQVGKMTPTYQTENPENIGCGFLSDGRFVTSAPGNQVNGPPDGELIMWFPPIEGTEVPFCKIDVALGTAGTIYVDDDDNIYIASARSSPGVYRFSGPFPTSADAAGGCGKTDPTGAPMADEVQRELFIEPNAKVSTPIAVMGSPDGTFFVSSVITGVIAEYDADGAFIRTVLEPPAGEQLGAEPFSTGTPFGLGFGPDGTLYYADIGIVIGDGIGPGPETGTVRRIRLHRRRARAARDPRRGPRLPRRHRHLRAMTLRPAPQVGLRHRVLAVRSLRWRSAAVVGGGHGALVTSAGWPDVSRSSRSWTSRS